MAAPKMTKNQMRRAKKKEQKKAAAEKPEEIKKEETTANDDSTPADDLAVKKEDTPAAAAPADPVIVEEANDFDNDDPTFAMYKSIFDKFGVPSLGDDAVAKEANAGNTGEVFWDDDDEPDEETAAPKLSKKKKKMMNKLSVAELKALVKVPEVVDWHDTDASDPRLLVQIKAQRNVVPVPNHWAVKREYLSSKRGVEKPQFRLPGFIAETGITEMRDAVLEKQAEQNLKQKQRERVQPKMGKLDIDYQKLYDAFFRFQTKPELTRFGEVYYEGKEAEVDYQHFRAGDLSEATREALGMPAGAPPPWLINQQRVGPPPSYPALKIPGLNAPPPPGGQWGFHPGGWGKPPVDEFNRPLYGGDVFGLTAQNGGQQQGGLDPQEPIDKTLWGELQPREEESEEEESDEEDEDEDEDDEEAGGADVSGMETPSGYASTIAPESGIETSIAGDLDLRKSSSSRPGHQTEESPAGPRSAYTILPQRQTQGSQGFFGSDHTYDLKSNARVLGEEPDRKRKKPGDIDVALDPEALASGDGLGKESLRRAYDEGRREEGVGREWRRGAGDDDLSEMIAEESRKRQKTEQERRERRR